jgi:hypothetical protein
MLGKNEKKSKNIKSLSPSNNMNDDDGKITAEKSNSKSKTIVNEYIISIFQNNDSLLTCLKKCDHKDCHSTHVDHFVDKLVKKCKKEESRCKLLDSALDRIKNAYIENFEENDKNIQSKNNEILNKFLCKLLKSKEELMLTISTIPSPSIKKQQQEQKIQIRKFIEDDAFDSNYYFKYHFDFKPTSIPKLKSKQTIDFKLVQNQIQKHLELIRESVPKYPPYIAYNKLFKGSGFRGFIIDKNLQINDILTNFHIPSPSSQKQAINRNKNKVKLLSSASSSMKNQLDYLLTPCPTDLYETSDLIQICLNENINVMVSAIKLSEKSDQVASEFWTLDYMKHVPLRYGWKLESVNFIDPRDNSNDDDDDQLPSIIKREFKFIKQNDDDVVPTSTVLTKTINHYHYANWKDGRPCPDEKLLYNLIDLIENNANHQIFQVNCRHGRGRSGTILMCHLMRQLVREKLKEELKNNSSNNKVEIEMMMMLINIPLQVLKLRLQRHEFLLSELQLENVYSLTYNFCEYLHQIYQNLASISQKYPSLNQKLLFDILYYF